MFHCKWRGQGQRKTRAIFHFHVTCKTKTANSKHCAVQCISRVCLSPDDDYVHNDLYKCYKTGRSVKTIKFGSAFDKFTRSEIFHHVYLGSLLINLLDTLRSGLLKRDLLSQNSCVIVHGDSSQNSSFQNICANILLQHVSRNLQASLSLHRKLKKS